MVAMRTGESAGLESQNPRALSPFSHLLSELGQMTNPLKAWNFMVKPTQETVGLQSAPLPFFAARPGSVSGSVNTFAEHMTSFLWLQHNLTRHGRLP